LKVTCVVPALNEAGRIKPVLEAITQSSLVDEVIVVSDGSTDRTYEVALEVPGVIAIDLAHNVGKAGAMCAGASRADADVIIFLDADLQGLTPRHVDSIVRPVREDRCDMCVGVFRGGRFWTDLAQKIVPVISGQRAIKRDLFLSIPNLDELGMGVEIALTRWAHYNGIRVESAVLDGVTHPMKEEKLGAWCGFTSRMTMYWDIAKVLVDGRKLRKQTPISEQADAKD